MYKIHIVDTNGDLNTLDFEPNTNQNLMVFITDVLAEDIGDCKGRAWCGTCMVQQLGGGFLTDKIISDEYEILSRFPEMANIRLACQIFLSADLHNTTWKVLDSRQFM
ncbi:2Fe-2S iron-sulfur cluster-binding protein [Tamlana sp. 2_MG-2023]|uniref:2Fe-2S iron-sulfur cluster-binding protein n=1 Tax=unclassified Tamlana TaxID=2614803 RepID=UPI0026E122C6|nr:MULTISPECIES: 2Fe-2S iron-sulfur cluster-binding protein [unclassified Tamlana]MDO6761791.1 2Fe-2S iron-sulfur cluster-binding protein [Tamlana sp. 2_MG-2023]MDO6792570.1 2Fe-2S iron-sulfur cluster-binding protein [Tamlana sp. 1_MG-2023]